MFQRVIKLIKNTYDKSGSWYKGNLHTHTENSPCGRYSIEKVIEMYTSYKMKYDFLAITDHYSLTELENYYCDDKIILFQGVEYKKEALQTLGINISKYADDKFVEDNHQTIFNEVQKQGGFNIICHPHAFTDDYWPLEKLLKLENYIGIEIFNNNVKHDNKGRAKATDLWDSLLSAGKKIYGFANDDMHVFPRAGGAFNMVLCEKRCREDIFSALLEGSFYASSGVFLDEIGVKNNTITVKAQKIPVEFYFIGKYGKTLKRETGISSSYTCSGEEAYVRVELRREDGAFAWTQPFFIEA